MHETNYESESLEGEEVQRTRPAIDLLEDLLPVSKRTRQALGIFVERAAVLLAKRSMEAPDEHLIRDTKNLVDCVAKMARININWSDRRQDETHQQYSGPEIDQIADALIKAQPYFEEFVRYKQARSIGLTAKEIVPLLFRYEEDIAKTAPQTESKPPDDDMPLDEPQATVADHVEPPTPASATSPYKAAQNFDQPDFDQSCFDQPTIKLPDFEPLAEEPAAAPIRLAADGTPFPVFRSPPPGPARLALSSGECNPSAVS